MKMLNRVWLAAVLTLAVSAAQAENGRIRFDLPAQPLAAALKTHAEIAARLSVSKKTVERYMLRAASHCARALNE